MTHKQALEQFLTELATDESGKSQAKLGDMRQILRLANEYLKGTLYAQIKARQELLEENA